MKKKKEAKIIYDEPPMKWDVALHKFVPDLPSGEVKKGK